MTTQRQRSSIRTNKQTQTLKQPLMKRPYFSVIIGTYNRRNLVLSTLASLRRQTLPYDQFEVIIVDNGSTDGTFNAIHHYVNAGTPQNKKPEDIWRVCCLLEAQNGLAYARNKGVMACTGEVAVFLDDDVLVDPYYLEHLLLAYQETGAEAIGGRVDIHWEAPRPHWLSNDLLETLGYFFPSNFRMPLPDTLSFSNCSFSVKVEALKRTGNFSPLISKRVNMPMCLEIEDFCQRLRRTGCSLWYDPAVIVRHRAPAARLRQAFFIGRAYWRGRAEILAHYVDTHNQHATTPSFTLKHTLRLAWQEFRELVQITFFHRPLLALARKATSEQLRASMAEARVWGHVQQLFQLLAHAPAEMNMPSVLFVRGDESDGELLVQGLLAQDVHCTTRTASLSFAWLWQHRAYEKRYIGIVHLYQPGSFRLTHWQRQRFLFQLWLAQLLGIRIVTTDAGGWWQSVPGWRNLARRAFERKLLYCSDVVLAYTRQPDQLYPDKILRRRVRCLAHPGFRGYYPEPYPRHEAHRQLGLPVDSGMVYLCFAQMHTEREILHLIDAFFEAQEHLHASQKVPGAPQLLLVAAPRDKKQSTQILKRAAINSSIHLFLDAPEDALPCYLGAANAIVIPHFSLPSAGILATAMLALSYERLALAPDLPRFRGMLNPQASILYDPSSRASLVHALIVAQSRRYVLTEKGAQALDAMAGWHKYAQRLLEIYKHLPRY
jgi:glycosyltransferase involved in cell wall biosynthesis